MTKYINADNLINELSAACMPIYEKGITGILGDNSSIADIRTAYRRRAGSKARKVGSHRINV